MRLTRSVAYRLAREDFLEVIQKGKMVDKHKLSEDGISGPIRLRLVAKDQKRPSCGDEVG